MSQAKVPSTIHRLGSTPKRLARGTRVRPSARSQATSPMLKSGRPSSSLHYHIPWTNTRGEGHHVEPFTNQNCSRRNPKPYLAETLLNTRVSPGGPQ